MNLLQFTQVLNNQQLGQDVGDFGSVFLGIFAQLGKILDGLTTDLDVSIFAEIKLSVDGHIGQVRKELEKFANKLGGKTLLFGLAFDGFQDLFVLLFVLHKLNKIKSIKT